MRTGMALFWAALFSTSPGVAHARDPDILVFFRAASRDKKIAEAALETLANGWKDDYASLVIDLARFLPSARLRPFQDSPGGAVGFDPTGAPGRFDEPPADPTDSLGRPPLSSVRPSAEARARERLIRFLEKVTGQRLGDDLTRWRNWVWSRPYEPHPDYALFKSALYGQIDRRMADFFQANGRVLIRLDEVDWGGVLVNGIPPLDHPTHVSASEARYLDDDDVIFGISLEGDARAYPKRILAWHELARDRVGGVELAIVYCTLCGTVIPYGAETGGRHRTLGTSGLLYRSNKLMFDEETSSLWSTLEGRPVIGALAGEDLELPVYPVVTTTWKEWRLLHPDTRVLSIDTGFDRDYSEGAAYRAYFRTDRLMFDVPRTDDRLKNKDEVLTLLLREKSVSMEAERRALALSAKFLEKNRLHHVSFAGHELLVVTSPEGANRVYDAPGHRFVAQYEDGSLRDSEGARFLLTEDALVEEGGVSRKLPRVPARRAFWFGWYAQFPETVLVK